MIGNRNPIGRGHHDYSYPRLQDAVGQTLSSVKVPMGLIDETMFTMFDVFLSNVDEHSDRHSVIHEIQRLGLIEWVLLDQRFQTMVFHPRRYPHGMRPPEIAGITPLGQLQ